MYLKDLIEKNRKEAFRNFVAKQKKQDEDTIEFTEKYYSYRTKRGKVKRYKFFDSFQSYSRSEYYPSALERCNGFLFAEVKNETPLNETH